MSSWLKYVILLSADFSREYQFHFKSYLLIHLFAFWNNGTVHILSRSLSLVSPTIGLWTMDISVFPEFSGMRTDTTTTGQTIRSEISVRAHLWWIWVHKRKINQSTYRWGIFKYGNRSGCGWSNLPTSYTTGPRKDNRKMQVPCESKLFWLSGSEMWKIFFYQLKRHPTWQLFELMS